jgi:hypothetical protein
MRALPLLPSDIYEGSIPLLAEEYVDMAFTFSRSAPPPTRKSVESQLSQIKGQAAELLMNLARLKEPAVEALHLVMGEGNHPPAVRLVMSTAVMKFDPRPRALGDIMGRLETLVDAASRAKVPTTTKDLRGRDRKVDALEIAKAAAKHYHFLTGKPPSRSKNRGSFPDFLSAIFEALDRHDDSVENLAKQASDWRHKGRPLEDQAYLEKLMTTPVRVEE